MNVKDFQKEEKTGKPKSISYRLFAFFHSEVCIGRSTITEDRSRTVQVQLPPVNRKDLRIGVTPL